MAQNRPLPTNWESLAGEGGLEYARQYVGDMVRHGLVDVAAHVSACYSFDHLAAITVCPEYAGEPLAFMGVTANKSQVGVYSYAWVLWMYERGFLGYEGNCLADMSRVLLEIKSYGHRGWWERVCLLRLWCRYDVDPDHLRFEHFVWTRVTEEGYFNGKQILPFRSRSNP